MKKITLFQGGHAKDFCKSNLIESEDKKTELFAYSTHSYKPIEPLSQPQIISASSSHDLSIHWGLL